MNRWPIAFLFVIQFFFSANILVANSQGLLRFDGSEWQLYHLPYRQIVRTVAVDSHNKIYPGGFAEFGYSEKLLNGRLQYHSLSSGITDPVFRREEIWNILPANDNAMIFHSFSRIYDKQVEKYPTYR